MNLHYDVKYPSPGNSFMDCSVKDVNFIAKDPNMHHDLSMDRVLHKKLRWITLGGQYDWTKKVYSEGPPPEFPKDIYNLLHGIFPDMEPQSAIANLELVIYEKNNDIGGTWYENRYVTRACFSIVW